MPRRTIELRHEVEHLSILDEEAKVDQELDPDLPTDTLLALHRGMLLGRRFDERMLRLQRQGRIGTFAPIRGQEPAQVGAVAPLRESDWTVPAFREAAASSWRGRSLESILLYYAGYNQAGLIPEGVNALPDCMPVATQVPQAVGIGYGLKYRESDDVALVFFGDGATSEGDFHESLHLAAVLQTPTVFACQNNQWAISVPRSRQSKAETLAQEGLGHGIPAVQVDGNDVLAVWVAKALAHVAHVVSTVRWANDSNLMAVEPSIDAERVRSWVDEVVDGLATGLAALVEKRGIQYVQGKASCVSSMELRVSAAESVRIRFNHAIVATGSHPMPQRGTSFEDGGRLVSCADALALRDVPEELLMVGAGKLGMGLAMTCSALGSRVTIVEKTEEVLPGFDRDLVRPVERRARQTLENIHLRTEVDKLEEGEESVKVTLDGPADEGEMSFDRVIVAVGRQPSSTDLGLENTSVELDDNGFIRVDEQRRTTDERVFAAGDVTGGLMLAHEAMYEAKVASDVVAGEPAAFDARAIPSVAYTEPEIAWAGLTQDRAREQGRDVKVGRFPWRASGRARAKGAAEGLTKMVFDADTERLLGIGIVGKDAGELIAEGMLAIEMGALATDIELTVLAHPTLSETVAEAAGAFLGHPTHIAPR